MPAEWEPHQGTWIAWPHNRSDWPGKFAPVPWVYAEIVRHLAEVERVFIIVRHAREQRAATEILKASRVRLDNLRFHRWPTNRVWTRDSGPIFVRRAGGRGPSLAITNWRFNAWAKYRGWQKDDAIPGRIARALRLPEWRPALVVKGRPRRLVLEGGAIDVNGKGTLLAGEQCLLSRRQQRNPGISRRQLESALVDYLGIRKIIWLGRGLAGDDTHGHVDDVARFCGPRTVVAAVESKRRDPNYAPLQDNLRRLKAATDQNGNRLQVVPIPLPRPVIFRGQRLPASYANFYIANRLVLAPVFGDAHDRVALDILGEHFPGREIVPVYCRDFIWGLGAVHCMTQQQPAE